MKIPKHPIIGFAVGVVIIVIAALIRSHTGDPLDLPLTIWFAALVLVGIGLITGGYLKKFKSPLISAEMEDLPEANPPPTPSATKRLPTDWTYERAAEYARVDGYMLAHVYRPSKLHGQTFDIFIFLVRHRKGMDGPPRKNFDEIEKVEFFFGESWGNEVFTVKNTGRVVGVRTHAWGTFLASCRVIFRNSNRKPITLFRYIDFHMLQDAPEPEKIEN
jgi:hypothetical protein